MRRNKSLTLFATHYFELTRLALDYRTAANIHLDAVEHKDSIVFLHAVEEGPADRSYGLQVAALAGVPKPVIRQAKKYLEMLEEQSLRRDGQDDLFMSDKKRRTGSRCPAGCPAGRQPGRADAARGARTALPAEENLAACKLA